MLLKLSYTRTVGDIVLVASIFLQNNAKESSSKYVILDHAPFLSYFLVLFLFLKLETPIKTLVTRSSIEIEAGMKAGFKTLQKELIF